jgi:hypothetical protein
MQDLKRRVEPEVLDSLAPQDPQARRARRDLRRVHWAMRSLSILKGAMADMPLESPPRRIIEIGAGDGSLMLRLARSVGSQWANVDLTLLDRADVVDSKTRREYQRLGWTVRVHCGDVFAWADTSPQVTYDLCVANLFLHHFEESCLARLLRAVANRTDAFLACEPRRDRFSRLSSRCVGLIGGNAVTREDAVKSVDAGFNGQELSECWRGSNGTWSIRENRAFPFSHCFSAVRERAATS